MPKELDEITIKLNELVKENFKRLKEEQSTPEGLAARQQRRDYWQGVIARHQYEILQGGPLNPMLEFKRYKEIVL